MASYRSGTAAPDASWLWHRRNRGWLTLSGSEDRDEQQENARPPGLYGDSHRLVTLVGCRINNDQSARRAPRRERGVHGGDHFSGAGEVLTWVSSLPGAAPVQDQQWQGLVDPCEPTFLMPVVCAGIRVADSDAPQWIGHAAFGPGPAIPERPLTVDVSLPAAEDTTDTHQGPEYRDVELPAWRSIKGYPKVSARSSAIARRRQAGASRVPVTPLDSARPQ
jgi:hypothetical protein